MPQFAVVELMKQLEKMGKAVKFAIHPVAGRMPGHAECAVGGGRVPYDKLFEMDDINRELPETDLVLVVGAQMWSTPPPPIRRAPIRMPILNAHLPNKSLCATDANPVIPRGQCLYEDPKQSCCLRCQRLQDLNAAIASRESVSHLFDLMFLRASSLIVLRCEGTLSGPSVSLPAGAALAENKNHMKKLRFCVDRGGCGTLSS